MTIPSADEVEQLLLAWNNGDQSALDKLVPLVYQELRRTASRFMQKERPDHLLTTTALVNETYLKLIDQGQMHWKNRAHFFAIAAQVMHRILLDYARSQQSNKRGGELQRVSFSDEAILSPEKSAELIAMDDALKELEKVDKRAHQVVYLRYFGGMTVKEIAEVLHIGESTVARELKLARTWLRHQLGHEELTKSDSSILVESWRANRHLSSSFQESIAGMKSEGAERILAEAWSNRRLIATLMSENWIGLKLLVQLRLTPDIGAAKLAFSVGVHINIVAPLLFKLVQFGALEEQHNMLTLTNRGDALLRNLEAAIGKNL